MQHLSVDERKAKGKAARKRTPRTTHATFDNERRARNPLGLLQQQAKSRVKELVPIRYGRMLVSPFTFYRGAALVMADDLATTQDSGLRTQVCGDAHLLNFGLFASAERQLVFDINDFDETLPGPWEWDVKRLAASMEIAARDNSFSKKQRETIVGNTARAYRESMQQMAELGNLDVWYQQLDVDQALASFRKQFDKQMAERADKVAAKARTRDNVKAFDKLTKIVDGQPQIISDPPLIVPVSELLSPAALDRAHERIGEILDSYRKSLVSDRRHLFDQYEMIQVARKVVGVGSVGTRAWIALMLGRDESDPLFLQIKEAQGSVLERYMPKSRYANSGQRVVAGQRLMQASGDVLLGWQRGRGLDGKVRDFYVRQLKDWKGSAEPEKMKPEAMSAYGVLCSWSLARAHARSGDRIAISSYLGNSDVFDNAIVKFSAAYADQNERDYNQLAKAVKQGKVEAETGI